MNSLLRWAGSKRKLISTLTLVAPVTFRRYVEPFAGSACLFFALDPSRALLGDINSDLIATYRLVKSQPETIADCLGKFKLGKEEYYRIRGMDPKNLEVPERAARFIYLNRFSFNGLYRTNRKGQFNVPYGGMKTGRLPSLELLRLASSALKRTKLVTGDFEETLKLADAGDFVYMDPPFYVTSRRVFNEYDRHPFGSDDIDRLRSCIEDLDRRKISFVVSYAKCKEAEKLAAGFRVRELTVNRSVAGFSSNRRSARELIISNISNTEEVQHVGKRW